ncbi:MAG: hypothetical protein PIR53_06285 [Nocardioides alkalitolerans]
MPARDRRPVRALATLAVSVVLLGGALTACGPSAGDGGGDGGTEGRGGADGRQDEGLVWTAVAALPTTAHDEFQISVGDLDRATELGGLERPTDPADEAGLAAWVQGLAGLGGGTDLGLEVPQVLGGASSLDQPAVADEIGTWLGGARWFGELASPPARTSVVEGTIDVEHLAATYDGEADAEGGRWKVGEGEDFTADPSAASPVRRLGQPLHLDVDGDRLTASLSEPDLALALAGDRGSEPALDLAEALDAHDVYAARVVVGRFDGGERSLPASFDAVAMGLTGQEGDAQVVVAYAHDDAASAEENADAVADVLADDPDGAPLEVTGTEVDGAVLTVTLRMTGDAPVRTAWTVLDRRAPLVSHR